MLLEKKVESHFLAQILSISNILASFLQLLASILDNKLGFGGVKKVQKRQIDALAS